MRGKEEGWGWLEVNIVESSLWCEEVKRKELKDTKVSWRAIQKGQAWREREREREMRGRARIKRQKEIGTDR